MYGMTRPIVVPIAESSRTLSPSRARKEMPLLTPTRTERSPFFAGRNIVTPIHDSRASLASQRRLNKSMERVPVVADWSREDAVKAKAADEVKAKAAAMAASARAKADEENTEAGADTAMAQAEAEAKAKVEVEAGKGSRGE